MVQLTLQLLGGFSGRVGSGQALSLGTRKAQALLAYLAVPPGRARARDTVASLLWGDTGDEQARQSLRQTLVVLRRALPASQPPILIVDRDSLALDPAGIEVDVQAFERLAAGGNAKALDQAMRSYRGDLLEGFRVNEEPFEDWLRTERARLRQLVVETLTRLLTHQSKTGETERAVHTAARLLTLDPVQEGVHRALMRLYARQGRRGEALRQYQVCAGVLQREFRVEPEAETKHLYRELLREPAPRSTASATSPRQGPRTPTRSAVVEPPAVEGRLIGREAEMMHLRQSWAAATRGRGQVVVILGEVGIGKSRLLAEVTAEASLQGGRVVLGHCYESEQILPYGPWADAFRTGLVIGDEAILGQMNPARRAELGRLAPEMARSRRPAPTADRLLLFESVVHVVEQLAAAQPIALGLEDLHWADELSLRLMAFVARRLRAAPVLIVATVREDEPGSGEALHIVRDELGREPHCSSLTLAPLSHAETAALVQAFAQREDDDGVAAARAEQVWAISEGNPLVVVETMRAFQEGSIGEAPGSVRQLPPRIREVIGRRLERLSPQAQELAGVASVIGQPFEFALLQRASGIAEREAAQGVEELVRRRILHGVGKHFDFTHDRVRAVSYDRLMAPSRRVLHEAVGRSLEEIYADNLSPHLTALGVHHAEAQAWPVAARYLWDAGRQALAQSAHREAVTCFERALDALRRLPQSRARIEQTVDLLFDLGHALMPLGSIRRMVGCIQDAEQLATALGDQCRLGWALSHRTRICVLAADYDGAIAAGERALTLGRAIGDAAIETVTNLHLGTLCHVRGDFPRALDMFRLNIGRSDGEAVEQRCGFPFRPAVFAKGFAAWSLAELGDFAEALAVAGDAVRLAESQGLRWERIFTLWILGVVGLIRGDLLPALSALDECLALDQGKEFPVWSAVHAPFAGLAYALAGRAQEALRLSENALRAAADRRSSVHTWISIPLGESYLRLGRPGDAMVFAARALDLARSGGERGREAHALLLTADIAFAQGSPSTASTGRDYERALALATQLGMRPLAARCHLGLGQLYRRTGDPTQAGEHVAIARGMLREMDMRFWLEQAEAELDTLA